MEVVYFGFCDGIRKLNMPDITYMDMYDGYFAKFYDGVVRGDDYDIKLYRELAEEFGNNILELACGSGRVMIPLLREGCNVAGVDLSEDMLHILTEKCKANSLNPEIHLGDMCSFKCNKKFNIVILSHISICLLKGREQLEALFTNVYENLLEENGVFVFNFVEYSPKLFASGELPPKYYFNPAAKSYTILFEKVDLENKKVHVNLYSEEITKDNTVKRYVGTTCKNVISQQMIDEIIQNMNFCLIRQEGYNSKEGFIRFYFCKKIKRQEE